MRHIQQKKITEPSDLVTFTHVALLQVLIANSEDFDNIIPINMTGFTLKHQFGAHLNGCFDLFIFNRSLFKLTLNGAMSKIM